MLTLLILSVCFTNLDAVVFDAYSGKPASKSQIELFEKRSNTKYCLIDVKPCDENEWRTIDGSCNNLKFPSIGMKLTPTRRLLTPVFSKDYDAKKTIDNKDMPLSRIVRNIMLKDGKATDLDVTILLSYFALFATNDLISPHDITNYAFNTTNCCTTEGKLNYICTPIKIPEDDPVHRFSGVRCQNLTRPQTFQYFGCLDFGTTEFARIIFNTPVLDMSTVYSIAKGAIDKLRKYSKGLLNIEVENGKEFPPSNPILDINKNFCVLNRVPQEKRCHLYMSNAAVGPNVLSILFYRHHNYIAEKLAQLNPCWSDDQLFYTAKDINIAIYHHIFFCELLPIILGKQNVINEGLCNLKGYKDIYDDNVMPQVSEEYIYIQRWFHNIQETDLKLFDDDGYYLNNIPIVNFTSRTGFLSVDNNINKIFQGSFRQPGAKADDVIDPDMGQNVLHGAQFASDVVSRDLEKGRWLGFPPYIKYREFCTKKSYKTFSSLRDVIKKDRIYNLKQIYDNVEDVELMAGLWAEDQIPGGMVPHTLYCLMVEQLKRFIVTDRHWYERPNRPHAFTPDQLAKVKKTTIAGVMCTSADGVTKIQLNAFKTISAQNPLTNCNSKEMGNIELSVWKDLECKNILKH